MKPLPALGSLLSLILLATAATALVLHSPASAQTPTPTPNPSPLGSCLTPFPGGETVTHASGIVRITPPGGAHFAFALDPPNVGRFTVCLIDGNATVTISYDCEEISRNAGADATTKFFLDTIVESCERVPATPVPTTPPFQCLEGETITGGGTVTIEDAIDVTLPAGDFVVHVREASDGAVYICSPAEEFSLSLRAGDCRRVDISPPDDKNKATTEAIVASCVSLHPATPGPVSSLNITPPSTGSAGMRANP